MMNLSVFSPVKRTSRSPLSLNEKNIILNVYHALDHQNPSTSVVRITEMCSQMTGVSQSTIYKILREEKCGNVKSPRTSTGRKKIIFLECEKQVIRRIVHSFYFKKEIPTLDKVLTEIKNQENMPPISRDMLWKTLKEMNFVYEKQNRKSLLIEKDEIICWRRKYLRAIKKFRSENRNIYYLDETWVNQGYTIGKVWQDKNVKTARQAYLEGLSVGIKPPSGKGKRLIITHVGSTDGFVDGGLLTFESKHTGDYHEDMNADVFEEYFEQMLDLIPCGSVIVMDNASYHSRKTEKLPTTAWLKSDIIKWLSEKRLLFEEDLLKKELLAIVNLHKHLYTKYTVDEMAQKRGIIVLRLPPYHCELNPIELVWAQVKGFVARRNTTYKFEDVKILFQQGVTAVNSEKWRSCVQHVMGEEEKFWNLDNILGDEVAPLIISLNEEESSTDYSEDE